MALPKIITLREFCETMKISRSTYDRLRSQGQAPRTLVTPRKVLFLESDVLDWVEQRRQREAA